MKFTLQYILQAGITLSPGKKSRAVHHLITDIIMHGYNLKEQSKMSKSLKQLYVEQRQVEAAMDPTDSESLEDSDGVDLEIEHDESDMSTAMDTDVDMDEGADIDMDESDDIEGEDDYDLESFDLATLMDLDDEDDDESYTSEAEDYGGEEDAPMEEDMSEDDESDDEDDESYTSEAEEAPMEEDMSEEDMSDDDESDDDESDDDESDDDESDDRKPFKQEAQWFERHVAAGLIDAGLQHLPISDKKDAVSSLNKTGYVKGSKFVKSLTTASFDRMQVSLVPLYKETVRVIEALKEQDKKANTIVANLRRNGKKEVAASMKRDMQKARNEDIRNAKLDYIAPKWLIAKVSNFTSGGASSLPTRSVNPVKKANVAVAMATHDLVKTGKVKEAASLLVGRATKQAIKAARVVHKLVSNKRINKAGNMVAELRKASYVNPDVKPIMIDPTQPSHEGLGQRSMGPIPDAGMSYGMDEEEVVKAMVLLECDPHDLKWVSKLPKTASNTLNTKGKVEVFASLSKGAEKIKMTFKDAKQHIADNTPGQVVLLANVGEIGKVDVENTAVFLQASASADPFYTVFVNKTPVAEVHLQDQDDPEAYRKVFADVNVYGKGMRDSMSKFGVESTLGNLRARYFATSYSKSAEIHNIREQAASIAQEEINAEVAKRSGEIIDLMMLAHEGIRKNAYSIDDPLKAALYERLKVAGLRENSIQAVIEESLNMPLYTGDDNKEVPALSLYLQTLVAKAMEFQKMDPEALKHISEHIIGSPVRHRDSGIEINASGPESLMDRLSSASQSITNVGAPMGGSSSAPTSYEAIKSDFKSKLGIGARYRNKQG